MIKISLGSPQEAKVEAIKSAFAKIYPGEEIEKKEKKSRVFFSTRLDSFFLAERVQILAACRCGVMEAHLVSGLGSLSSSLSIEVFVNEVFRASGLPAGLPGGSYITTKLFIGVQIFGGFPKFFKHHRIYITRGGRRASGLPDFRILLNFIFV